LLQKRRFPFPECGNENEFTPLQKLGGVSRLANMTVFLHGRSQSCSIDFSSEKKMFTAELERASRLLSSLSRNNPLLEDFREAPSRRHSPRVEEGAANDL